MISWFTFKRFQFSHKYWYYIYSIAFFFLLCTASKNISDNCPFIHMNIVYRAFTIIDCFFFFLFLIWLFRRRKMCESVLFTVSRFSGIICLTMHYTNEIIIKLALYINNICVCLHVQLLAMANWNVNTIQGTRTLSNNVYGLWLCYMRTCYWIYKF